MAHAYRFQDGGQNGRFQDGWVGRFCHVNAVRTSFWKETHSGMKLILVSCEQPLSFVCFSETVTQYSNEKLLTCLRSGMLSVDALK